MNVDCLISVPDSELELTCDDDVIEKQIAANADLTTCIVGSANPDNVRKWAAWADMTSDDKLIAEVLAILSPIHNWFYVEGRPENNDERV